MRKRPPDETGDGKGMNKGERKILWITCYGHFMTHFNMLVFPALVLPLAASRQMDVAEVLGLSFFMYMLFGLTALPWGLAADRLGGGRLMALFFAGAAFCCLAAGLMLGDSFWFAFWLGGLGLFAGIYHPAGLGMISTGVRRVSMAMGYNGMAGNLGLAAGPLLTGLMVWLWGIESAYYLAAALNLAGLALIAAVRPESRVIASEAKSGSSGRYRLLPFVILLVCMMLGGVTYRGTTVILPALLELKAGDLFSGLVSGLGVSDNLAATGLASAIYLFGVVAQYFGGWVGERFETARAYLAFHALSLPAAFLTAQFMGGGLIGLVAVYLFFLLGMQPLENTLVGRLTPPGFRSSAFGAKFIFTFGVGALAVPLAGWVQGAFGVGMVLPAMGVFSALLVITILLLLKVLADKPRPSTEGADV